MARDARPAFGLYLHVPFCLSKCPYCDFYSEAGPVDGRYLDAVTAELHHYADTAVFGAGRTVATIYLGGGTPSLWPTAQVGAFLDAVARQYHLVDDLEVTLEANPATLESLDLAGLRRAGVNRLSLGVQSLDDRWLRALGRRHDAATARQAVAAARQAGFTNVSVDVILAIPGQTLADSASDVAAVASLGAEHVSAYLLSLEEGTPLGRRVAAGEVALVDDDTATDMGDAAVAQLAAHGYGRYEISNFARPGRAARHNRAYWHGVDYLGLGPAAHSHYRTPRGEGVRVSHPAQLDAYLRRWCDGDLQAAAGLDAVREILPPPAYLLERIYLGLRDLERGVDLAVVAQAARQEPWALLRTTLATLASQGLLVLHGEQARLTDHGARLADQVARAILQLRATAPPG